MDQSKIKYRKNNQWDVVEFVKTGLLTRATISSHIKDFIETNLETSSVAIQNVDIVDINVVDGTVFVYFAYEYYEQ